VLESFPPGVDTPNEKLVNEAFELLVGRIPDPGELAALSNELDAGVPPIAVIQQIQQLPGYIGTLVNRAFREWLHRDADPFGLAFWAAGWRRRRSRIRCWRPA